MKIVMLAAVISFLIISCNGSSSSESKSTDDTTHTTDSVPHSLNDRELSEVFETIPAGVLDKAKIFKNQALASKADSGGIDNLIASKPTDCAINLPKQIKDLNSGAGFQLYKFTSDMSAAASLMGFSGNLGKKELLIIEDYTRYKTVNCNGTPVNYGIGLRCYIKVKSLSSKISASLANIAASVQLDKAEATFNLKSLGFGLNGDLLVAGLSDQSDYNVDNFGKLGIVFNNVLKTLSDSNSKANINPAVLPAQ